MSRKEFVINNTTLKDVFNWIHKTNSITCLQKIRSRTNKRIKVLLCSKEESPFKNISIEQKREIIKPLLFTASNAEEAKR